MKCGRGVRPKREEGGRPHVAVVLVVVVVVTQCHPLSLLSRAQGPISSFERDFTFFFLPPPIPARNLASYTPSAGGRALELALALLRHPAKAGVVGVEDEVEEGRRAPGGDGVESIARRFCEREGSLPPGAGGSRDPDRL